MLGEFGTTGTSGSINETQVDYHHYTVYRKNADQADSEGTVLFHIDVAGGRYRESMGDWVNTTARHDYAYTVGATVVTTSFATSPDADFRVATPPGGGNVIAPGLYFSNGEWTIDSPGTFLAVSNGFTTGPVISSA